MAPESTDEELMERIVSRDEEAFRILVERHGDRVYGTAARMMGGAGPEVEELTQDVFLRIWRSAGTYRPEGRFVTWLLTIVRNQIFTRMGQRKRRKRMEVEDSVDPETGDSLMGKFPDRTVQAPSEALAYQELQRAVETACSELPEHQRLILHLRQYEGLDFQEISKITGMSVLAAKALMFRARESLKKKLSGYLTASN